MSDQETPPTAAEEIAAAPAEADAAQAVEPEVTPAVSAPSPSAGSDLPIWFRIAAIGVLVVLLAAHIIIDIFVKTYEGNSTSLMLGGIVGTALGLNEFLRGRQQ